jgi:predicted ATPase/class 3 adenylate cyclase/Tfp pilus assembly protein PilF
MLAPTGTVTLVFTDLRASAALWSDDAATMREALTRHDKLLRETLRRLGGYEVKAESGAFMLAFERAEAAVRFAADMQLRLLTSTWSESLLAHDCAGEVRDPQGNLIFAGLRVTIGMHCGEPDCRIAPTTGRMDYFGPVANRAARVSAAAHEGQILLSKAVKNSCAEIDEIPLADLGSHRLRGLEDKIHLFEAQPEQLKARRFPPPLTLDAIRTNLHTRGDRFVGRDEILGNIAEAFEGGHRLLTLMGASGLGKTRLAQRFGGLYLETFPGGVWFCDLADSATLSEVIATVGRALSTPLTSGRNDQDLLDQVATALAGKGRALLIFDNLEQVIEPSVTALNHWINAADELCILTTSQERLRLSFETAFEVRPLNETEATELFEVRAREARGSYQPSMQERRAVAEVVCALDYVPLAIELAAAQANRMSAFSLSKQLKDRLDLLTVERSDIPLRHRTLRAAIEWSWGLLNPTERNVLAQASVFRGGFTLEGSEQVIEFGDPEVAWVMDLIETLADKSFLNVHVSDSTESELRFSLFESIRIFAGEILEGTQQAEACHGRHAAYFAEKAAHLVAGLYGPDGAIIRHQLNQDRLNFQAVASYAGASPEQRGHCVLAQIALLKIAGPMNARGGLLDSLESTLEEMSPGLRGKLLRATAEFQADNGEVQAAMATLEKALKTAHSSQDEQLEGRVLGTLGMLQRGSGEIAEARKSFGLSLSCARRCGDDPTRGAMLNNLATLEHDQARFSASEELFLEALELALARGQSLGAATAQMNLGTISAERGHLRRAKHYYHQALERFGAHGDRRYQTTLTALLGLIELDEGHFSAAKKRLGQAHQRASVAGDAVGQIMSEVWHGIAHWLDEEEDAAFLRLRSAAQAMGQLSNPKLLAFVHAYYGAILTLRERPGEAREEFRLARYLMQQSGNRNHLDALKILVGVASASLAKKALQAGDEKSFARHLSIALARRDYAHQPRPASEAFPEGLPAPVKRSTDARICLKLLQRNLAGLPGVPADSADVIVPDNSPQDTLPPLNPWESS